MIALSKEINSVTLAAWLAIDNTTADAVAPQASLHKSAVSASQKEASQDEPPTLLPTVAIPNIAT
jgi:hypothetical protein